jgi:hypothetical protein
MKFSEVIDALMEYKPISRSGWADGKFLYLDKEQNWFAYHIKEDYEENDYEEDDYEEITYRIDLKPEDVIADDWEILDEVL